MDSRDAALLKLPSEVIYELLDHLGWRALPSFASCCQALNGLCRPYMLDSESASGFSGNPDPAAAFDEAFLMASGQMRRPPQAGLCFVTVKPRTGRDKIISWFRSAHLKYLSPECSVVGCTGRGILGTNDGKVVETESGPAVSLLLLHLPRFSSVESPIHAWLAMGEDEEDDEEGRDSELQLVVPSMPSPQRKWANIYTLVAPSDVALGSLQASFPGAKISGGLASSSSGSVPVVFAHIHGQFKSLFYGAAMLALSAEAVQSTCDVSRGVVALAPDYIVTGLRGRMLLRLRPDQEGARDLPAAETLPQLMDFIGIKTTGGYFLEYSYGVDDVRGGLEFRRPLPLDTVRPIQLRFYVLEPRAAEKEVRVLLQGLRPALSRPFAAVLFTCNGRAQSFYGRVGVLGDAWNAAMPSMPTVGFFGGGEIAPTLALVDTAGSHEQQEASTTLNGFTTVVTILNEIR